MQGFFEHPHLLDGALARAFAYSAISILLGLQIWEYRFKHPLVLRQHYCWTAMILGVMGLILAINATAMQANNPFDANVMALPDLDTVTTLLLFTTYGKAWLAYTGLLMLAVFSRKLSIHLSAIVGMVVSLVLSSHSGENGVLHYYFWINAVHMTCALAWFGGLTLLVVLKYGEAEKIHVHDLKYFSGIALPLFLTAFGSGLLQLTIRGLQTQLDVDYLTAAGIKLLLVLAVMACAWTLRGYLKRQDFPTPKFDNGLNVEYFLALLLLITVGILTQIEPT